MFFGMTSVFVICEKNYGLHKSRTIMQELILGLTGVFSSISFTVSGFGPAMVFLFVWFACESLDALSQTSEMVDAQSIMACMTLIMTSFNSLRFRNETLDDLPLLAFTTILSIGGNFAGVELLMAYD